MNRKLKKYYLKYEYLKLEDEDAGETLQNYVDDFEKYFDKFYKNSPPNKKFDSNREVWVNEETGEVRETPPPNFADEFTKHFENFKKEQAEKEKRHKEKLDELKNRPEKVKKLYKKLAAHAHPDRGGSNELFQKVNKAYESNNLMTLLNMAGEYGLEYDVDDNDEKVLEKNLLELEKEIERKRNTLAWAWGSGDKNQRLRVVSEVERQTGWKVEEKDLPEDLVDKPEEILQISTGSLEDSK